MVDPPVTGYSKDDMTRLPPIAGVGYNRLTKKGRPLGRPRSSELSRADGLARALPGEERRVCRVGGGDTRCHQDSPCCRRTVTHALDNFKGFPQTRVNGSWRSAG